MFFCIIRIVFGWTRDLFLFWFHFLFLFNDPAYSLRIFCSIDDSIWFDRFWIVMDLVRMKLLLVLLLIFSYFFLLSSSIILHRRKIKTWWTEWIALRRKRDREKEWIARDLLLLFSLVLFSVLSVTKRKSIGKKSRETPTIYINSVTKLNIDCLDYSIEHLIIAQLTMTSTILFVPLLLAFICFTGTIGEEEKVWFDCHRLNFQLPKLDNIVDQNISQHASKSFNW